MQKSRGGSPSRRYITRQRESLFYTDCAIYYKTERDPVLHRLRDILQDRESLFYTDYAIYYKTEREPVLHRLRDILQDRERACSTPTTRNSSPVFCLRVIVNIVIEFIQILKRRYIVSYMLFQSIYDLVSMFYDSYLTPLISTITFSGIEILQC